MSELEESRDGLEKEKEEEEKKQKKKNKKKKTHLMRPEERVLKGYGLCAQES